MRRHAHRNTSSENFVKAHNRNCWYATAIKKSGTQRCLQTPNPWGMSDYCGFPMPPKRSHLIGLDSLSSSCAPGSTDFGQHPHL